MADRISSFIRDTLTEASPWPPDPTQQELGSGVLPVPTRAELVERVSLGLFRWPYVQILRHGKPLPPAAFSESRTLMGTTKGGFTSGSHISGFLGEGCSVVIHSVEHWDREFSTALSGLADSRAENLRSYVCFGEPLYVRPAISGSEGLAGIVAIPLSDSEPLVVKSTSPEKARTYVVDRGSALLLPGHDAGDYEVRTQGPGGTLIIEVRMPTMSDAIAALVERFGKYADENLISRYHNWDVAERRRRAVRELVRVLDQFGADAWAAYLCAMKGSDK